MDQLNYENENTPIFLESAHMSQAETQFNYLGRNLMDEEDTVQNGNVNAISPENPAIFLTN